MREIKFRVWADNSHVDKPKSFVGWERLNPMGQWQYVQNGGSLEDDNSWDDGTLWSGSFRFLREQYTGLEDRNGVEIYEGDIVWLQGMKEKFVGPVVFDPNKGFIAKIPGKEAKPRHKYAEPGFVFHLKNCKVIGNVYQNPELIK